MINNYVDTNLCDFTGEILTIMKGGTPQRRYARYANPALSNAISKDTLVPKAKSTCKDGKDDGKISLKEKLSNFGKGFIAPVKNMFSSPKNIALTALTVAGGVALIGLTGGAAAPVLAALGIAGGAIQIGRGIYNQATATTDEQAQKAWQQMGSGTFTTASSALAAKGALKASHVDTKGMSTFGAIVKCFKDLPSNIRTGFKTAGNNIGGIFTSIKNGASAAPKPSANSPSNNLPRLEAPKPSGNSTNNGSVSSQNLPRLEAPKSTGNSTSTAHAASEPLTAFEPPKTTGSHNSSSVSNIIEPVYYEVLDTDGNVIATFNNGVAQGAPASPKTPLMLPESSSVPNQNTQLAVIKQPAAEAAAEQAKSSIIDKIKDLFKLFGIFKKHK